ncbi:MAG TPA: hypothetical protein VK640_09900 [Actinomycetes bacterium]|nr:hypothetical protein [Actinomycetes bacterium]
MTNQPDDATTADDAAEAVIEDATEDLVTPPRLPDEDGPDAPTVDSGGGPQGGAADDRS